MAPNTLPSSEPRSQSEILRRGAAEINRRLPEGWKAKLVDLARIQRPNGLIELVSPAKEVAQLFLVAKRSVEGRAVVSLRHQLDQLTNELPNSAKVVVAPYLSQPVRSRLTEAGLSYVDLTGNIHIELSRPGIFLADRGANSNPWRGPGRPRTSLRGEPAARVVRALVDIDTTWRITKLIETAGTSAGATYRVVEYLETEGLAKRDEAGAVRVDDWKRLLQQWSNEYSLVKNSRVTRWIAPRGISTLLERMAKKTLDSMYALTGTLAAAEWAAYAPASLATIYAQDPEAAAQAWGLLATDANANVMIAEPQYSVVFDRSWLNESGVRTAAASQVYVDLATGPGRNPNEAEELLKWMQQHERAWRQGE